METISATQGKKRTGEESEIWKDDDHLLKVKRVAWYLDMSPQFIHNLVKSDDLQAYKIGGRIRISLSSIKKYLAARKITADDPALNGADADEPENG